MDVQCINLLSVLPLDNQEPRDRVNVGESSYNTTCLSLGYVLRLVRRRLANGTVETTHDIDSNYSHRQHQPSSSCQTDIFTPNISSGSAVCSTYNISRAVPRSQGKTRSKFQNNLKPTHLPPGIFDFSTTNSCA